MRFSLLLELARRDFSERYAGSVIGMLWALLLPLVIKQRRERIHLLGGS